MVKNTTLFRLCCLLILSSISSYAQRPNIVYIIADDLGYGDVQFNNRNSPIRTPNLNSLANNGTVFNDAYVSHPFCGPSRMSIMTGRYPHRMGVQYNLGEQTITGLNSEVSNGIPRGETVLSEAMKNAGYNTAAFGKWHLGLQNGFRPIDRGFDYFYGFLGGGHQYEASYIQTYRNQIRTRNKFNINAYFHPYERQVRNGNNNTITEVFERKHATDAIGDDAVNYIGRQGNKPFFMYVAFNAPHAPLQPLASDENNAGNNIPNARKKYAGLVYGLDRNIGKIVKALRDSNKLNNTLIVFISDNGGKPDEGASNAPLKGRKGDVLEGGFRVPMLWSWGGNNRISNGSRRNYSHPVSTIDLYPTLIRVGRGNIRFGNSIGNLPKRFDGKNILTNVQSNTNPRPYSPNSNNIKDYIFALRHRGGFNEVAIRQGNWKAFRKNQVNNAPWRLYNIANDVSENNDVARSSNANRTILNNLIRFGRRWATGNVPRPRFFGALPPRNFWRDGDLPNYPALFDDGRPRSNKELATLGPNNLDVRIYPNPASTEVSIFTGVEANETSNISIYNIEGKIIMDEIILGSEGTINVTNLNGLYIIKVENANHSISEKLVIQ